MAAKHIGEPVKLTVSTPDLVRARELQRRGKPGTRVPALSAVLRVAVALGLDALEARPAVDFCSTTPERT